ncbi:MAG: hypothetical protein O7B99_15225 [Planctomycetota bacterium]|nr:hypothetical protein [Planctomycetota bacterium]
MKAVLLLVSPCCACLTAPLEWEPWDIVRPGAFGLSLRPALFGIYRVEGDFTAETPAKGTLTQTDSGDLEGRFGLALEVEYFVTSNWMLAAGVDYRVYDIDGLNPIQGLDVEVETVETLQYYLGLRHLFAPFASRPRLRPYVQGTLVYLPEVDIGFEVDLSAFGSSNLEIDAKGDGYWVAGVATGLMYHWTPQLVAELGIAYELPLTSLDADLTFSIGPSLVPFEAELEPEGLIGFWGLTYFF